MGVMRKGQQGGGGVGGWGWWVLWPFVLGLVDIREGGQGLPGG